MDDFVSWYQRLAEWEATGGAGTAHFWCHVDDLDAGGYPSAAFKATEVDSIWLTVSVTAVLNTDEPGLVYSPNAEVLRLSVPIPN